MILLILDCNINELSLLQVEITQGPISSPI